MKQRGKLQDRLLGLTGSIMRFPLTAVFLLAAAIIIIFMINSPEEDYSKLIITFVVGSFLSIVAQVVYERFFRKMKTCFILMGVAAILTGGYYLILTSIDDLDMEIGIRTIVAVFALLIAFLWIPVIKSKITFNESFMAVFKSFFIAIFFSGVLFLGVSLILGATDMLIMTIDGEAYMHSANIIFVLFAPLYFLSMIPVYTSKQEKNTLQEDTPAGDNSEEQLLTESKLGEELKSQEDFLQKATSATKFLETLISYVIIPITAVFTVILLLYIIMNITGSFWTDNLLEPLLVSYSITVIIVYLLAARINNAFARNFRRIFPKVLVPIVLFQTISSIIRIGDMGITYGRYYVILFGVFATIAGILFSILPIQKNGIIAPILLVLSFISILPPIDAFTISRINQTNRLESVLRKNNMLEGTIITPNTTISETDQQIIVTSMNYLENMQYNKDIKWLSSYNENYNFEATFGFEKYGRQANNDYKSIFYYRRQEPIPVTGYDFMVRSGINSQGKNMDINSFVKNGITYTLRNEFTTDDAWYIVLLEGSDNEVLRFPVQKIFNQFADKNVGNSEMSTTEATFTEENERAVISVVLESISINQWQGGKDQSADANLLVKIK